MKNIEDIIGKTFGKLTVMKYSHKDKQYCHWYECKCTCGKIKTIREHDFKSGKTVSCGCTKRENSIVKNKNKIQPNEYIIKDNYVIGFTSNTNNPFYIDLEDYLKIIKFRWYETKNGYARSTNVQNYKIMHRFVLDLNDKNFQVDHINHNKLDNRKTNLRICNSEKNGMNRLRGSNNTSGVKGVSWHCATDTWQVYLNADSQTIYVGNFTDFNEAVDARLEAEEKYHQKFAFNEARKAR